MNRILFLAISVLLAFTIVAQQNGPAHVIDSLLKVLAVSKNDTNKAIVLLTLANLYETNNQDSADYYLKKGKALSEALKFEKGIFYYYQQSTVLQYTKGNYSKALEESNKGAENGQKDEGYRKDYHYAE